MLELATVQSVYCTHKNEIDEVIQQSQLNITQSNIYTAE